MQILFLCLLCLLAPTTSSSRASAKHNLRNGLKRPVTCLGHLRAHFREPIAFECVRIVVRGCRRSYDDGALKATVTFVPARTEGSSSEPSKAEHERRLDSGHHTNGATPLDLPPESMPAKAEQDRNRPDLPSTWQSFVKKSKNSVKDLHGKPEERGGDDFHRQKSPHSTSPVHGVGKLHVVNSEVRRQERSAGCSASIPRSRRVQCMEIAHKSIGVSSTCDGAVLLAQECRSNVPGHYVVGVKGNGNVEILAVTLTESENS
eukprot:m.929 g.929  ORF g.929 m.929 type:complete len:261 (+) comp5187_c0_seq1:109-891(+)